MSLGTMLFGCTLKPLAEKLGLNYSDPELLGYPSASGIYNGKNVWIGYKGVAEELNFGRKSYSMAKHYIYVRIGIKKQAFGTLSITRKRVRHRPLFRLFAPSEEVNLKDVKIEDEGFAKFEIRSDNPPAATSFIYSFKGYILELFEKYEGYSFSVEEGEMRVMAGMGVLFGFPPTERIEKVFLFCMRIAEKM